MQVDEQLASQWFKNVSYYRLSAYWYPVRMVDKLGKCTDSFVLGSSFQDAASLYEADRKLRTLVHDGMERIEIAMRTRIGDALSVDGPLAYTNQKNYREDFDLEAWLTKAQSRIKLSSRRNEAIQHYATKYAERYSFWVLAEVLDFSDVSRLYEGLPAPMQREIAERLNINIDYSAMTRPKRRTALTNPPLVRWLEQLTIARNACAHHARLWNKSFAPAQTNALKTIADLASLPPGQSERVYGVILLMSYLLREISPGTTWPDKAANLIITSFLPNPIVWAESLGLPSDWNKTF